MINQFLGASMNYIFPVLSITLLTYLSNASAENCMQAKEQNQLGSLIAKAALNEYAEFNGHRINADGYLWKFGSVEAETEPLLDPDSGKPDASRLGGYAWRRVWEYWLTLEKHVPGTIASMEVISVPGLLEETNTPAAKTIFKLTDIFSQITSTDENINTVLRQSVARAALTDTPWSAAFLSYLMDRVGLNHRQFRYSSSHWEYIQAAFENPEGYAYKACDPRHTMPSRGDLLCYGRGENLLKNFAKWKDAVRSPNFSTPSHCDVVVNVDTDRKKIEVIGGNVLQSVTIRKLRLNEENVLSDSHILGHFKQNKNNDCAHDKTCEHENLNLKYWSVLLQLQ